MSMPLADNHPLYHSDYLLGPIETIVRSHSAPLSGNLSLHDITEAYRTLSMRIRQSSCHLTVASECFPALEPLRDKGTEVVAALRRDVSRALPISAPHTPGDLFLRSSDHAAETVLTTYEANVATDSSVLCHYALRLLSEIFRFPAISSVLACTSHFIELDITLMGPLAQDVCHLLGDVISIIRCPQLRILSSTTSKTAVLSSWVLRTQRLPRDVLLPRMEDVILYLNFILESAARDSCVAVIVVDALNCIVNLLTSHQHVFVARLANLLPSIFPFVIHKSSEFRHHSAVVLASFSHTLITHRTLVDKDTIETICFYTHSFLTPETTRHPTSSRKLPPLFDAAVSSKNRGSMGGNSPWALTLVASFVVLLGPSLFLHHGPLKLVMNVAQKALRHRPGRDLNPHVWRTFIWSMTQLNIQRSSTPKGDIDVVQRCVLVLKQALHAGLGAALISSLLEATSTDHQSGSRLRWVIPSVLDILHDMLSSKYQDIRKEAYRILGCLTHRVESYGDPQRGAGWAPDALISRFLLDGSLLHADTAQLEEVVGSAIVFTPRCLSQEEILTHWGPVASCFDLVVRNSLKDINSDLTVTALPVWQSLLLAQVQPIQGHGRPSASADFGPQLTSLLLQFLPDPLAHLSGEAESIEIQLHSLVISKQLWAVVQDVFLQSSLKPVASSFLTAILNRAFHIADRRVLTSWCLLCSTLIVIGIPNVSESILHQNEAQRALEIKRQLWRLAATQSDSPMLSNSQNLISILVFPIGSWCMSEDDLDIWERALDQNLPAATKSTKAVDIIDTITSKCSEIGPSFPINTALRVAIAMLPHLSLDDRDSIPTRAFSYLNTTLTASYPPQSSVGNTTSKLLKGIHHIIISMHVSLIEPILFAVQTGLAGWIEDKSIILSTEQYNDLLMPLYDSLLLRLESLPISIASLNALTPLLTAAFSHIPPPALGPAAFQRFFYAAHARLAAPSNAYTDELRVCLDACVRGYGGEWPSGMVPLSSSSQTQSQFHMEPRLTIEAPASPAICENIGEQFKHIRSIEHEVIPDSQCIPSNTALCVASQTKFVQSFVRGSSQSESCIFPDPRKRPSQTHPVSDASKEIQKSLQSLKSAKPQINPLRKRRRLSQDMPATKRHCAASPTDALRTHSAPLTRLSSPVVPSPRFLSMLRSSPHSRLVMDCVEVVPIRQLLRRRKADAERDDMRSQHLRSDLDDCAWEVTPERPFVHRMTRDLLEKDEIVPETPDAVLRLPRMSLSADEEPSPQRGSPSRLLGKAQPLARGPTTSTRLVAALNEVHDVFSRPGLSQIPVGELADSAKVLDAANRRLQTALAMTTSKNVALRPV